MYNMKDIAQNKDTYGISYLLSEFWKILHSFTEEQKKAMLVFVTASDRIPLKGFKALTFVIQQNGQDSGRLPTALTCFGRLLLPEYSSPDKLRELLLIAIQNSSGFGLI
eukprot:NODE_217_length_14216_cov_0.430545.p10 type:complete len:109 gc:universal NODE_217_length_14216_cov_0.430545:10099-9773(-)